MDFFCYFFVEFFLKEQRPKLIKILLKRHVKLQFDPLSFNFYILGLYCMMILFLGLKFHFVS